MKDLAIIVLLISCAILLVQKTHRIGWDDGVKAGYSAGVSACKYRGT
jgi:hypothetical protein